MNEAFRRFAWGILWMLIDIRIMQFDVLPDAIGFAFMWSAVRR